MHGRRNGDGFRVEREGGLRGVGWLLLAGAVLGATVLLILLRSPWRPDAPAPLAVAAAARPTRALTGDAGGRQRAAAPRAGVVPVRRRPDAPAGLPPAARPAPTMPAADDPGSAAAGEEPDPGDGPTGIALFPPPGTEPLRSGIIVPEDFPLPEGYVRHYQATDTGERLPAILMFHPDYEFVDAEGRPIEIPPDRIVPPHLAPPGLPLEVLTPPDHGVPMLEPAGEPPAAPE